jgi:hypothetical protein
MLLIRGHVRDTGVGERCSHRWNLVGQQAVALKQAEASTQGGRSQACRVIAVGYCLFDEGMEVSSDSRPPLCLWMYRP